MILPTKHISQQQSLLGVGAMLLSLLDQPMTVSNVWDTAKMDPHVGTYSRMVLALDLLFMLELVEFDQGLLLKISR